MKVHGLAEPDLLAGTLMRDNGNADTTDGGMGAEALPDAEVLSTRSHSSLSSVVRKKGGGFLNKLSLKTQRWKRNVKSAPPEASEAPEALTTPNQPSADEPEAEVGSSSGVVAGLSQIFEDLSGRKSSGDKRVASRCSAPEAEKQSAAPETPPEPQPEEGMSLPSSPPPVPLEIQIYNSSPSSSHQTAIIR